MNYSLASDITKPQRSVLVYQQAKTLKELTNAVSQSGIVPKLKINLGSCLGERSKDHSRNTREESVTTPEIQSQRYTADNVLTIKKDPSNKNQAGHMRHRSALDGS